MRNGFYPLIKPSGAGQGRDKGNFKGEKTGAVPTNGPILTIMKGTSSDKGKHRVLDCRATDH